DQQRDQKQQRRRDDEREGRERDVERPLAPGRAHHLGLTHRAQPPSSVADPAPVSRNLEAESAGRTREAMSRRPSTRPRTTAGLPYATVPGGRSRVTTE